MQHVAGPIVSWLCGHCTELLVASVCAFLVYLALHRLRLQASSTFHIHKDPCDARCSRQFHDDAIPQIRVAPGKALAQQVFFIMRLKRRMRRFQESRLSGPPHSVCPYS